MRRLAAVLTLVGAATMLVPSVAWAKEQHNLQGAESAFRRYVAIVNNRQWDRYYDGLHPAQQKVITKDAFMTCIDSLVPEAASITNVKFTDHYNETVTLPGTQTKVKSTALTVKYVAHVGQAKQAQTDTVHLIWSKNRWNWALSAKQLAQCSGAAPPSTTTTAPTA
jgi:hypothetical protein